MGPKPSLRVPTALWENVRVRHASILLNLRNRSYQLGILMVVMAF